MTAQNELPRGLRISLIAHGALIASLFIGGVVIPSKPRPYIPSLRVDLVGLPDILKKDLNQIQGKAPPQASEETVPQTKPEKAAAPKPKEVAKPDEMVLKPKKDVKESKKGKEEDRTKKLKGALARIKALSKISGEETKTPEAPIVIKGNKISKGSSLSGDARENADSGYYDQVLGSIRENWALPVYLSRQNLTARVRILIDAKGNVTQIQFTQRSGNSTFDEEVRKAIHESQPLPRPPADLQRSVMLEGVLLGFPL